MKEYLILSILTVLIHLLPNIKPREYSVNLVVSLFLLFLYGAFRVDFGLDYQAYFDFFNGVKKYGLGANERMELGYFHLNNLLPTFRSLLIVQTLLLCTAYYYLFKWYIPEKWAWLGFLLLFLSGPQTIFFMLSGIRNGIAISIFIFSTYFILRRKMVPFAILIFVAFWFHKSIILYAPIAYFVANGNPITKKSIWVWLTVIVFFALASSTIILDYVNIFISNYLDRYMSYVEIAGEYEKGAGPLIVLFSSSASVLLLLNARNQSVTAKENMLIKLSLFFLLSYLLGPLNMRMSQYFISFFIPGSILMVYRNSNNAFKYAYMISIFLYAIYAFKIWVDNPDFSYDTYKSIMVM